MTDGNMTDGNMTDGNMTRQTETQTTEIKQRKHDRRKSPVNVARTRTIGMHSKVYTASPAKPDDKSHVFSKL